MKQMNNVEFKPGYLGIDGVIGLFRIATHRRCTTAVLDFSLVTTQLALHLVYGQIDRTMKARCRVARDQIMFVLAIHQNFDQGLLWPHLDCGRNALDPLENLGQFR